MVRPHQQLHAPREPVPARPAATVLLLRDGPQGLELLMTRRSARASFAPGAYVFPGGRVDPADADARPMADRREAQDDHQLTQAIAALRECFEELGVLLARDSDGRPVDPAVLAAMDRRTAADAVALAEQCRARGLRLAADEVFTLAHWITDRDLPKRFDVPFLVARMPAGQEPVADETEQFEPCWVRPREALERHAAGSFEMIFPTLRTLERLGAYDSADQLLDACRAREAAGEGPLWTSCPRAGLRGGEVVRFMEHEPPFGELELTCPDGQILHALDWNPLAPAPLLRNLRRLTAANAGVMTGPGTNSYLVGDAGTGYAVIDPGPNDPAHLERLWAAAGGDIRFIVCTHSHADHSPGAAPLAALCATRPPILGMPSAETARPSAHFVPERTLVDGERLQLAGPDGTHTLRVIATPGHAANHLCLMLEEDALLFSGDHVLNGSTTVVDPPDGDMDDYLDSLDRLQSACAAADAAFILPAHGHVIGNAPAAIARLKAHRLAREARIADAMRQKPDGGPDDWLPIAYADVPPRMWPVAARSLAAHVARLRRLAAA